MKVQLRIAAAGAILATALPAVAVAQVTVNWDDLGAGNFIGTPAGYHGFDFYYGNGGFGGGPVLEYSTLGARCNSAPNCAYNAFGTNPIRIESLHPTPDELFTFAGFLSGGYPGFGDGPFAVLIQGFLGESSVPVFSSTFVLPTNGMWVHADLTANSYNKLLFSPVTVTGDPSFGYILLDDATFGPAAPNGPTTTPEPASIALVGTGLAAIALARRRRRRTAGTARTARMQ